MDASCKIQRSIHVFNITNKSMCPDFWVHIIFKGNGFLYNMVRILTGTLVEVGLGKTNPEDMPKILEAKDRSKSGATLPPRGLILVNVEY